MMDPIDPSGFRAGDGLQGSVTAGIQGKTSPDAENWQPKDRILVSILQIGPDLDLMKNCTKSALIVFLLGLFATIRGIAALF